MNELERLTSFGESSIKEAMKAQNVLVCFAVGAFVCVFPSCGSDPPSEVTPDAQLPTGSDALPFVPDASVNPDIPQVDPIDAPGIDTIADAPPDGPVRCMPDSLRCRDSMTAERCLLTGDAWVPLSCASGCDNNACKPLQFSSGWSLHQFELTGEDLPINANFVASMDALAVTQTRNGMAAAYLFEQDFESVEITGRFVVETVDDDDFFGLVFGWQDPQNFYFFDWKKSTQVLPVCGEAKVGVMLKVAKASAPIDHCADFWSSAGSAKVASLASIAANPAGWRSNTPYDFRLVFRPGNLRVEIKDGSVTVASLTSNDATIRRGKFGLYAYSQQAVRYENIRVQPAQP